MKRIAVALAVLFAAAAVHAQDAQDAQPAEVFAKRCGACHGKDGKGNTPMAQKLGAQDLTTLKAGEPEITEVIANGRGKMPAFKGKLSDGEIKALAKYVKSGLK